LIIAELRMRDRLTSEVDVPQDLRSVLLPPLLLQPLVENALRHGIEPSLNGGQVRIAIRREGDGLRLRVTDTGVGLHGTIHEGVGLATLRQRLATLYDSRGKLSISSHHPSGTVAEVIVPLWETR
jgi:LytS/YehU family sensor histidine kinase